MLILVLINSTNTATFNNTGSNHLYVSYSGSGNVFNGLTTFNNATSNDSRIYVGRYATNTIFNENIILESTSGEGVHFNTGNTSSFSTLAAGKTISIGAGRFTSGTLSLRRFTQSGTTAQNIALSGSSIIDLDNCLFNGPLTVSSPNIYTSNNIFNSATSLTKSDGTSSNATSGG